MATLAAVASAVSQGQASLVTATQFATDTPAIYLADEAGDFLTADDGSRLIISTPMRGMGVATAALSTATLFATDDPGAVYLTAEDGSHITAEDGSALIISSPQRGLAYASASLSTIANIAAAAYGFSAGTSLLSAAAQLAALSFGASTASAVVQTSIALAVSSGGLASGATALTTAARFAALSSSVATGTAAALTGITLTATVTGLSYASVALGAGTLLTVTAAGLASASGALLTQTPFAAASSGWGSTSAQLTTGSSLVATASSNASAFGGLSASIQLTAQATGLASASPALSGSISLAVLASGVGVAQAVLNSGSQLLANAMGAASAQALLQTAVAPYSAVSRSTASASADLNGNVMLVAIASSNSQVIASLKTVLQPPGEFADIRWLRAPRGGEVAYAEFFQAVGEQLWYGVNWEDWLASNWEPNSTAILGQALRPTVPNGLEFVCITAGQTGAVEPTWPAYSSGVVVDGTALWQAQPVSVISLDDSITNSNFSAPAGITIDSGQVAALRSYLIIETPASIVGTDYDVLCTVYTQGGQQKIAKLRIKVR